MIFKLNKLDDINFNKIDNVVKKIMNYLEYPERDVKILDIIKKIDNFQYKFTNFINIYNILNILLLGIDVNLEDKNIRKIMLRALKDNSWYGSQYNYKKIIHDLSIKFSYKDLRYIKYSVIKYYFFKLKKGKR